MARRDVKGAAVHTERKSAAVCASKAVSLATGAWDRFPPARFCTFVHVVETMALRWRSLARRTAANLLTRDEARRIAGQHREAADAGADSGIRVIEQAM